MSRSLLVSVSVLALLLPGPLVAQAPAQETSLRVSALELSLGGRLHTQLNTTSVAGQPPSRVFLRRARLEVGVKIDDRISGVIQPDFGDDDVELKDAYMRLTLSPAAELLAGKAYRPFGLLEQTSSKRMLPVERGLRIRGLAAGDEYALTSGLGYSNRDIGLQVMGAPAGAPLDLGYAAGVFRGPLHGAVGDRDSYQLAARVTARPVEDVRLGAGWSSRDFASGVATGHPELRRGNAFEVDLEYGSFAPGLHVLAEVALGDLDPFLGATFWGAQSWIAYRTAASGPLGTALEPLLRLSHGDTEGPGAVPGGTLLTPGLSVYFGPLSRFMLNYDVWLGADDSADARSFKAMVQLAF